MYIYSSYIARGMVHMSRQMATEDMATQNMPQTRYHYIKHAAARYHYTMHAAARYHFSILCSWQSFFGRWTIRSLGTKPQPMYNLQRMFVAPLRVVPIALCKAFLHTCNLSDAPASRRHSTAHEGTVRHSSTLPCAAIVCAHANVSSGLLLSTDCT